MSKNENKDALKEYIGEVLVDFFIHKNGKRKDYKQGGTFKTLSKDVLEYCQKLNKVK